MMKGLVCAAILCLAGGADLLAAPLALKKQTTVRATIDAVWNAWTTEDGLRFISNKSNVKLTRGGPYEWFLDLPPDEQGKRGGEGARVLAWLPHRMLAFSWTFPPSIPALRHAGETFQVVVEFEDLGDGNVSVTLTAHEWQSGPAWEQGRSYFERAWASVLTRLKKHLEAQSA